MTATNVHLDPLPEGKVIASRTKELNDLRVPDLEDAVIEDPEPGSGIASSRIVTRMAISCLRVVQDSCCA